VTLPTTRRPQPQLPPPDPGASRSLVVLHHVDPSWVGHRIWLEPAELVLGRDGAELDLFDDDTASRRHCALRLQPDGALAVTDLGSTNGTWLDGRRIESGRLAPGSRLRVGGCLLRLEPGAWPEGAPRAEIPGASLELWRLGAEVERAAERAQVVTVLGEPGVGKEVVALALHAAAGRQGSFVAVNCGAIADPLLHSELFGHVRGSFSGAEQARTGLVREAHRGTLFLDEIGDATAALQVALLRTLQEREVRAVGADVSTRVDLRVVAATHRPLEAWVEQGRFRADLWGRLSQWVVRIPPLRERPADLAFLAHLRARELGLSLSIELLEALLARRWPGNARELENTLARLAAGGALPPEPAPAEPAPAEPSVRSPRPSADALRVALRTHGGNVRATASALGVSRKTLYKWMDAHGIDPSELR
jgi:DNA-binding NtrC family response regulator